MTIYWKLIAKQRMLKHNEKSSVITNFEFVSFVLIGKPKKNN